MARIVIDPGHGGYDPGALGSKSKEKDNVLKVALKLGDLLSKAGHEVLYTRKTDVFISLFGRADFANKKNADVFISLHNNSASNNSATGFETFIYSNTSNKKTKELQDKVHKPIADGIGLRDRGKKSANFLVLRETKMPALLIEYAFINNVKDEKVLIDEVNKLAELTYKGVIDFIGGKVSDDKPKQPAKPKPKPKPTTKPKPIKMANTYIGMRVESKIDNLRFYSKPSWADKDVAGRINKGIGFPNIVSRHKVGDGYQYKVKNSAGAVFYVTAASEYVAVKSNKVTKPKPKPVKPTKKNLKVGSKVTIKNSARFYSTGQVIPSKYKGETFTVQQVGANKVLIKELYSWVNVKDLA